MVFTFEIIFTLNILVEIVSEIHFSEISEFSENLQIGYQRFRPKRWTFIFSYWL